MNWYACIFLEIHNYVFSVFLCQSPFAIAQISSIVVDGGCVGLYLLF